jgi:hypothetical protein
MLNSMGISSNHRKPVLPELASLMPLQCCQGKAKHILGNDKQMTSQLLDDILPPGKQTSGLLLLRPVLSVCKSLRGQCESQGP